MEKSKDIMPLYSYVGGLPALREYFWEGEAISLETTNRLNASIKDLKARKRGKGGRNLYCYERGGCGVSFT